MQSCEIPDYAGVRPYSLYVFEVIMARQKSPRTPRSRVRQALRLLWLRSRERASACKRSAYSCESCGVHQSKKEGSEVSIEVHHLDLVDWEDIINMIMDRLIVSPDRLMVLCRKCHMEVHGGEGSPGHDHRTTRPRGSKKSKSDTAPAKRPKRVERGRKQKTRSV